MKLIKMVKIILILFIIVFILSIPTKIYAAGIDTSEFEPPELTKQDYNEATKLVSGIITAIKTIGIIVAVAGLMVLGIKYMVGSIEQKAEYKKTMWPYFIGCVMLFIITQILSLIYSIVSQF